MSLKSIALCAGMVLILALTVDVESQYSTNYDTPMPPRLYFQGGIGENEPYLVFSPVYEKIWRWDSYNYFYEFPQGDGLSFDMDSNSNISLLINGIKDMIFNPDIEIFISIETVYSLVEGNADLVFKLRCDGDGDGDFEYIIDFPEDGVSTRFGQIIRSPEEIGIPINMTDGTMELFIERTDSSSPILPIDCNYESYIQTPFDYDTDSDGIGDMSDPDDDGDGVDDRNDAFPRDPDEWKDSDHDGIGDNSDNDHNGNNVPDDLEIPIAMGIVLIPLVLIMALMNKMKKKGGKEEEEGEWGEEDIPILTTPHEGPKNW